MTLFVAVQTWVCETCQKCLWDNVLAIGVFDNKETAQKELTRFAEESNSVNPNYFIIEVEPGTVTKCTKKNKIRVHPIT